MAKKLLVWLGGASSDDAALVGEKVKKLSELVKIGLPVLNGFIITTTGYKDFLENNKIATKIQHLQVSLSGEKLSIAIKKELAKAKLPKDLSEDILTAYVKLVGHLQHAPLVVSFSKSSEQVVVKGEANLLIELKNLWIQAYKANPEEDVALTVQLAARAEKEGMLDTSNPDTSSLPLSPKGKEDIVDAVHHVQKHFFFPQTLSWIISEGNFYITDIHEHTHHKESIGASSHVATKIYLHMQDYKNAPSLAKEHVDGVGLLRYEYLMQDNPIHPKTYIEKGKKDEFITELAEKISGVCAAFSPRCVVYRTSDLTTADYERLENGKEFETTESNPMLGYRGAYRTIHNPELFLLEMEAIKQVRNKMGHKNLWLMIPFVRSAQELEEVKKIIASSGLYRSPSFKIWMMVEIPSNVILLDSFIEQGLDGVVIEPNNLTTLLTGTDKNNRDVVRVYHEDNPASLWAYEHTIKIAHKHKITSSYCGQKEGISPFLLEKLILWGISSVSLFPETVDSTRQHIAYFEKEKAQ